MTNKKKYTVRRRLVIEYFRDVEADSMSRVLSDDDLAEADRQTRKVKEETE